MRFTAQKWATSIHNKLPSHDFHFLDNERIALTVSGEGFDRMVAYGRMIGDDIKIDWIIKGFKNFFK